MKEKLKDLSTSVRLLILAVVIFSLAYSGVIGIVGQAIWNHEAEGSLIGPDGEKVGSELIGQDFDGPQFFHSRPSSIDYNAMESGSQNLGPQEDILFRIRFEDNRTKYKDYRGDLKQLNLSNDIREKFEEIDRTLPENANLVSLDENKWRITENGKALYSVRIDPEEIEFYRRSKLARRVENSLSDISEKYENEIVPADFVTESGSALDPHITVRSALFQIPRVSRNTPLSPEELRSLVEELSKDKLFGRTCLGPDRFEHLFLGV